MIFKTYESALDGISNKFGFSKRSFAEWGTQVSQSFNNAGKGLKGVKEAFKTAFILPTKTDEIRLVESSAFNSLFNRNAEDFFKSFNKYGNESISTLTTWCDRIGVTDKTMKAYLVDCMQKQVPASFEGYNNYVQSAIANNKQLTLSAKASQVALKALSFAMNVAANIGLSILISKIAEAFTANDRLLSSAKELGETFLQEQSSIEDYKNQINLLQNTINDSSSSFDNVTDARKKLMNIQDELIKKYGTEEETVEKINEAINGQANALDSLTKKQYLQWKNNFNDKDFGETLHDFFLKDFTPFYDKLTELDLSGAFNEFFSTGKSNIGKMVNDMHRAYFTLEKTGNDTLDSLIAKTYNLGSDGTNFVLQGNLNDVYETLIEIQELASDYKVASSFEASVTKLANRMDKTLQSYKDSYDIYVLYEKILDSSEGNPYDEQFHLINKAKEKHDEALVLGNTDKIKEAADEYAQTLQYAIDLAIGNYNWDVADYFKAMYPELQQTFGEWQFNLNFESNTDGLKDRVTNALDTIDGESDGNVSLSIEDIKSFNVNTATQEQIEAYGDLTNAAKSYGLTLNQLLALFQTMGLVQSENYQQLINTFGRENIDKLCKKDLEIAYSIENVSDMTFDELQAEIEKTKKNAEKFISFSIQITKSKNSLDQFQSAVKSAAEAYTKLLTGNYSSFDLLDSIHAINQAATNMGQFIDWETIAASDNPLQAIQDEIESITNTYAESVLSGVGIDIGSDFSKMLANIIQESYRAEAALSSLNTQIDSLQSAYDNLTDIIETYNETGYITFDQLQTLLALEPQYLACLIDENGQLQLNQEAMIALANQRIADARAQVIEQTVTELNELAYRKEQATIEDNSIALNDNMETVNEYEKRLLDFIPTVGLTTNEFVKLSNAMRGAKLNGVSDEDIDKELEIAERKMMLINEMGEYAAKGGSIFDKMMNRSSSSSSKDAKDTTETFNWIETAISRIQRVISNLGDTVSATWKNWTQRNSALASELAEVKKEISLQQSAYEEYMKNAESIGLSDNYKNLIQNGGLSIEDIADETLKEQINDYQDWYEKALACEDAVSELNNTLADLAKTKFDNITSQYDAKIQDIDHTVSMINGELDKTETLNQIAGESFYNALIDRENARLENLAREYSEKLSVLNESVSTGVIENGSEAWQEMKEDIDSVAEAIQEADNNILKYQKDIKEIAKLKFDSLESQFDNALSLIASELSQVDKQIALIEEAGYMAGEAFYQSLIEAEQENVKALAAEYESLSASLAEAMGNGSVTRFDDNWYDMVESINSVEDALLDAETALISYGNSLKQLEWDVFDRMQESISRLSEESDFLIDLMSTNNDLYNKNGTYNDRGLSVQGLHAVNYDVYMRQAQEYADAIKTINADLADDPNNMTLIDRYHELLELQREAVQNAEDEKSAIKDLISDGYDRLLSYLDELIDARKKALNAEKDMHDYEKTVSEQAATVEKFQKLLVAYQGDDSESMKATIQKAQASLIEAEEALQETEYEKYMSDQEALLDNFRDDMEEWVNIRLDDINGLIQQAIDATNANAKTISAQINSDLSKVGMTLTENFAKIFEVDYSGGVRDIISGYYGSDGSFETAMTTLNSAIDGIIVKSDDIKMSTDGIITVLNQRFPELAAAFPNLDTTNGRIVEVKSAIDLVRQAIEAINVAVANLNQGKTVSPLQPQRGTNTANTAGTTTAANTQTASAPASTPAASSVSAKSSSDSGQKDDTPPPEKVVYTVQDVDSKKEYFSDESARDCHVYISANDMELVRTEGSICWVRKKQTSTVKRNVVVGGNSKAAFATMENSTLNGYENGLHDADEEEIAYTDENGREFILSPLRGGILTHILPGDSVMTAEQTERIYRLGQMTPDQLRDFFSGSKIPELNVANSMPNATVPVNNTSNNDVTVNITVPNITNKEEFQAYLRSRDSANYIKRMVADGMLGRNQYNRLNY